MCSEIIVIEILNLLSTISIVIQSEFANVTAIFLKWLCGLGTNENNGDHPHNPMKEKGRHSSYKNKYRKERYCVIICTPLLSFRSFEAVVRNICAFTLDLVIFFFFPPSTEGKFLELNSLLSVH